MRGAALILGVALGAGVGPRPARAQPAPAVSVPRVPIEVDNCAEPPPGMTPDQIKVQASEHFDRGEVLYEQGDYTRAVADLVWAYCMAPRYYTILKSIGQAYERALDYEKAIAYFELYAERIPADAVRATPCDPDPQADRYTMKARIKVLSQLPARVQIDTPVKASVDLAQQGEIAGRQVVSGAPFDVPGGRTYTATIRADGYVTVTRQIETHVGRPTTEFVPLARETGKVRIRVTPAEAKIALDNSYVGTGAAEVTIEARHYTLLVDAPDYVPLTVGIDVLPGREVNHPYELQPIAQFGHRQLLLYSGIAGAVVGSAGLGVSGNQTLAGVGTLAGAAGGLVAAYYGTERDVPLGTSSLTITSSLIGGVAGLDVGLVFGGNDTLFADATGSRTGRAMAGGGLVLGAVTGYVVGEKKHVRPGDAAVVNSGALWGGVAGHLLGFTFLAPNSTIGGLGLVGLAMGTTGGVLLTQYYAASRKHAALIDASGVAGMITGVATANLIFNQRRVSTADTAATRVTQERTADFALGGLAVGLILGGVLTRTVDLPKIPAQLQVGQAATSDGKTATTYGLGGTW